MNWPHDISEGTSLQLPEVQRRIDDIRRRAIDGENITVSDEAFVIAWSLCSDPIRGDKRAKIERCFKAAIAETLRLWENYNATIVDRYLENDFGSLDVNTRDNIRMEACMGWSQRIVD